VVVLQSHSVARICACSTLANHACLSVYISVIRLSFAHYNRTLETYSGPLSHYKPRAALIQRSRHRPCTGSAYDLPRSVVWVLWYKHETSPFK